MGNKVLSTVRALSVRFLEGLVQHETVLYLRSLSVVLDEVLIWLLKVITLTTLRMGHRRALRLQFLPIQLELTDVGTYSYRQKYLESYTLGKRVFGRARGPRRTSEPEYLKQTTMLTQRLVILDSECT